MLLYLLLRVVVPCDEHIQTWLPFSKQLQKTLLLLLFLADPTHQDLTRPPVTECATQCA